MSDVLEPREVHRSDIKDWWTSSLEIFRRQPAGFLLISLCYYFAAYHIIDLSWVALLLGLVCCQVFISIGITLAQSVDESKPVRLKDYMRNIKNILVYLFVMAFLYSLFFAAIIIITMNLQLEVPANDYSGTDVYVMLSWMLPGLLFFEVLYIYTMITSLWFFNPLLVLNNLSIKDCVFLSRKAFRKNEWVVFIVSFVPFLLFYLLLLTTELILVFIFFAYPLFCIFQYISYRHVFLGRKENQPDKAKQMEGVLVQVKS